MSALLRRSEIGRRLMTLYGRRAIRRANGAAKIHLGCGERILDGYWNVDFPPESHTLQRSSGADFYADIRALDFPDQSFAEVRLHHVFEHFDRPTALVLLARWHGWLSPGGRLVVETPDFDESARTILDPSLPWEAKAVAMRHLFGSHEASWAYHLDGWNEGRFRRTLERLGYADISAERTRYKGIANLVVRAARGALPVTKAARRAAIEGLLGESLVDDSSVEAQLLALWMQKVP